LLVWIALDDFEHQTRELEVLLLERFDRIVDGALIKLLYSTPQRIGKHFFRQTAGKSRGERLENALEVLRSLERLAVGQRSRRVLHLDPAKLLPRDVVDAVVPAQPFVEKGEVGIEEIDDAAIFLDDRLEEQLDFLDHRVA